MKGKKYVWVLMIWIAAAIFLSACSAEERAGESGRLSGIDLTTVQDGIDQELTEEQTIEQSIEQMTIPLEAISIDFPFPYGMSEYTLALVASNEKAGQYDLQVCNKYGLVEQQFLCGELTEPITFRFDDLSWDGYPDLEIFSADSETGILFLFRKDLLGQNNTSSAKKFAETAMEIPCYDEANGANMVVRREDEKSVEKTIYQLNMSKRQVDEIRQWKMQKDTGMLEIRDCLEQRVIFEGKTEINETGEPVNENYYHYLFWQNIYLLNAYSESDRIPIWISEPREDKADREESGYEYMQYVVFGNSGHTAEYTDRQSLLEEFGFDNEEPAYVVYDSNGNLNLELYMDETTGTAAGFVHEYRFTSDQTKLEYLYGFTIDAIYAQEWEEPDPSDRKSVNGTDGADEVRDYEEILNYREDGQLDYFHSQGIIDWLGDEEDEREDKDTILQISCIYRDDGTLFYRKYRHNSFIFGTTFCARDSFYDEAGRISYQEGYITHGSYLYYYFYEGDGRQPKYCLVLDDNLGYYIPMMMRYR